MNREKRAGSLWITLGLLLIAGALCLTSYNLYDALRAGQSAVQDAARLEERLTAQPLPAAQTAAELPQTLPDAPDYVRFPDMEMPVETIDGREYIGVLQIPALELELPVMSQWSYKNLKTAPCRYSGSAYQKNLILCAHNYPAHFGLLKNLRQGDGAVFTDMAGNVFTYKMAERETLLPGALEAMESGDWDLTLFTCTAGGKSRVTLRFTLDSGEQ